MIWIYLGGCQNYGPFLGPKSNTAPIIWGTQKGTIILTTTHLALRQDADLNPLLPRKKQG